VGTYSVTASATGYVSKTESDISVQRGESTTVDFDLLLDVDLSLTSSKNIIMTGGVQTDVHQCTITATVSPVVSGDVTFSIAGSTGYYTPAHLSQTSVALDSNGQARTVLTSSDLEETITVRASLEGQEQTIDIYQDTSSMSIWFEPDEVVADGQSTMAMITKVLQYTTGTEVPGHSMGFVIIEVRDEYGNLVNESEWSDYGTLLSSQSTTDSNGIATTMLQAGTIGGVITIEVSDYNDWVP